MQPQPSRPWQLAHGSLVEMPTPLKTLRPGHIPPSPHPTPATGNDYSLPGQPKLATTGQVVSGDPYPPIPKHSTAQMAPMAALATHAQRSFFLPLPPRNVLHPPPPTDGLAGSGVTFACQQQGAGSEDVP